MKPYNKLTRWQTPYRSKTIHDMKRNSKHSCASNNRGPEMLKITFQRWTKDYSEERHRKRDFPAPTRSFPSIENTLIETWATSTAASAHGVRCQPQTPNKNNQECLIHLHPMKITCPGAIQRQMNNSILKSWNANVFLLLKNKETFRKNILKTPGLCVLWVLMTL